MVLILLFFGFTRWNWFGNAAPATPTQNNPAVASPMPSTNSGAGGSPSAAPSASPSH
jgi:hypothetical protein